MGLTKAERILIERRRRGETQDTAAGRYRVSTYTFVQWERGILDPPSAPKIGSLAPHEVCLILRRRAGITQADVASSIGRSRDWITLMETGKAPCQELKEYWGE